MSHTNFRSARIKYFSLLRSWKERYKLVSLSLKYFKAITNLKVMARQPSNTNGTDSKWSAKHKALKHNVSDLQHLYQVGWENIDKQAPLECVQANNNITTIIAAAQAFCSRRRKMCLDDSQLSLDVWILHLHIPQSLRVNVWDLATEKHLCQDESCSE